MGLKKLKAALIAEAEKEADSIMRAAEKQKAQIIEKAQQEKREIIAKAVESAKQLIAAETSEKKSAVHLRAKKLVQKAVDEVIENSLEKIWQRFVAQKSKKGYEKILKRLIEQGIKEFGRDAVVSVNSSDKKIASRLCKHIAKESSEIVAGAVISSSDKSIRINNSFEAIFSQKRDRLRKETFDALFGGSK